MNFASTRSTSFAAGTIALAGMLLAGSGSMPARAAEPLLPIVFVHGGAGSAAQYETQAMRFASNGYPNVVTGIDRTSSISATLNPMLDAFFDGVMAETGDDQIFVVAHSLGVALMNTYLNSSPARTARVARYVGIDSASAGAVPVCPGTPEPVPCMGIYRAENAALMLGANNVYLVGGHVEMVTSADSFAYQYEFLTGGDPVTTLVLPEPPGQVEVSGKAINFPANTGADGATVELWEVHGDSGARKGSRPREVFAIGPTGEFGPVKVNGKKSWEFSLTRPDVASTVHYYYQPFMRSDSLVRLLLSPPTAGTVVNTATGPDHAAAVLIRYKEWWADQGAGSDTMWITTTSPAWDDDPITPSPPPQNALQNPAVATRAGGRIGMHVHDAGADKASSLAPIPFFLTQAFQTGVDVWMPATEPPDGTITFLSEPRGDATRPQVVNVANWASEDHRIVVQWNDYVQDIDGWNECKKAKPSPCK